MSKRQDKTYVIDLGFNLDAGVERAGFPLSAGLVDVPPGSTTGEGDPQWFTCMKAQGSIAYRLWDNTSGSENQGVPICFRATWVEPTKYNALSSPFIDGDPNPIVFSGAQILAVNSSQCQSSVYPNAQNGWIFGDPHAVTPPLGESFTLGRRGGSYFLKARLDMVINGTTIRTFHWDPEVVVGGGGGGGGGGGDEETETET